MAIVFRLQNNSYACFTLVKVLLPVNYYFLKKKFVLNLRVFSGIQRDSEHWHLHCSWSDKVLMSPKRIVNVDLSYLP